MSATTNDKMEIDIIGKSNETDMNQNDVSDTNNEMILDNQFTKTINTFFFLFNFIFDTWITIISFKGHSFNVPSFQRYFYILSKFVFRCFWAYDWTKGVLTYTCNTIM
jgi:hypothetical protein